MKKKLVVLLLAAVLCFLGAGTALAYNESPMLRVMVAAGELPPLEERLPEVPAVLEPLEEIGRFGGTVRVFSTDPNPWNDLDTSPKITGSLLGFPKDKLVPEPNLALGYELSEDNMTFTLYLRKGVKWSDGVPFTVDDIMFMLEDMIWHEQVSTYPQHQGVERLVKIDDYTIRFELRTPNPMIRYTMTGFGGSEWTTFMPKHYLKKWHIDYNPEADELAKEEGFETWYDCLDFHMDWAPINDINKPTLHPWVLKEFTTTFKVFERNPYYWKVDTAGNQLPYIDRIVSTIVDREVYHLKIITGETDIAYFKTSFANYPLYKESEEEGNYRVVLIPSKNASEVAFSFNQNHPIPELRELNQDVRYRRALSLAINRQEISDSVYFGLAIPFQVTKVLPTDSHYKKSWGESYIEYDPEEANRLLDEVGLTERDKNGFRIGPDGETLLLLLEYRNENVTVLELVKEYWEAVGVKVLLKGLAGGLWGLCKSYIEHDVLVFGLLGVADIGGSGGPVFGYTGIDFAVAWGHWLEAERDIEEGRKTLADFEGGVLPGEEPPDEIKQLREWQKLRGQTEIESEEFWELTGKMLDWQAENLPIIGTVGMAPRIYIAKKNIGNVPTAYWTGDSWMGDLSFAAIQLFFKD